MTDKSYFICSVVCFVFAVIFGVLLLSFAICGYSFAPIFMPFWVISHIFSILFLESVSEFYLKKLFKKE